MASLEIEARLDNLLTTTQTEMADVNLFAPITDRDECPICLLPFPIRMDSLSFFACCGKYVCVGCTYKNMMVEADKAENGGVQREHKCPFCRLPINDKQLKKLIKKNHPLAFMQMGYHYQTGTGVIQSDSKSLDMFIRAAELGVAQAFVMIGNAYAAGEAVAQDVSKALEYYEIAAKRGRILSHYYLALYREKSGDIQISINHLKVIACAGHQLAMDKLMNHYRNNSISKEDLAQTLRAYQASSDLMKSKERDEAQLVLASRHT